MKRKSYGKQLLIVLLQTIPVVLGVFFALYVNNTAVEKKDKNYINSLTKKAKNQIIKDTTDLSASIQSHTKFIELLNDNLENDKTLQEVLLESNGINTSSAYSSYLKILIDSKIEYLEINKASEILEILDLIEAKEKFEEQILQNVYDLIDNNSKQGKMKFMMLLNDYSLIEMRLLESQKQFVKR